MKLLRLLPPVFLLCFAASVVTASGIPSAWDQGKAYSKDDLVIYGGTTYQATSAVPAGTPTLPSATGSLWKSLDGIAAGLGTPGGQPDTTPGTSGLTGLQAPTDSNGTSDNNSSSASGATNATDEQFVKQQYLDFLGREPDSGGLTYWVTGLGNGSIKRADVVNYFVFSDEFQEKVAPVSRLYQAYFLRIPDTDGLTYWIGQKLNGLSLNDISTAFAGSQEFADRYGSLDNSGFANLVYTNVLGRQADSEGLTFWTNSLNAGTTRGSVMTGFSESTEYKASSLNKIRVIAFYYGMLRRAPEQAGFDFWVGVLDQGGSAFDLIDGFLKSAEYQGRF